ncbi:MAG: N-6 DNA methylase, partial [Desulfobacteraceae bacterium]|nr:N-6 DNA methylase [Desulfobacteraceae bacterium]
NAEATIRTNIVKRGLIKGIIGLPANLFFGTGIPACIIVIDKENAGTRKGLFMIDASKGYIKDGNKNRLREQDLHKIVDVFNNQMEVAKYSRMVSYEEIETNEYNLNIPRYIDSQEEEDIQDIEAHLLGDIPNRDVEALRGYWDVYPSLKEHLFHPAKRVRYSSLVVPKANIKETIFNHAEFIAYRETLDKVYTAWEKENKPKLWNIDDATKPKQLIFEISESLLHSYE